MNCKIIKTIIVYCIAGDDILLISEIFKESNILINLKSKLTTEVFNDLVSKMCEIEDLDREDEIIEVLLDRESKRTSGIIKNVAIPHAKIPNLDTIYGMIGISKRGIDFDSLDKAPVHLVFLLTADIDDPETHLKVLKNLALLLQSDNFYENVTNAKSPAEVVSIIKDYEKKLSQSKY